MAKFRMYMAAAMVMSAALCAAGAPPDDGERTLQAARLLTVRLPDGRTASVEKLGRPLPGKATDVEFVSVMPDGERIAWAVTRSVLEHFLIGYGEKSGLHRLDLTRYFVQHSIKPTITFHKDRIYVLAGNMGPALIRYDIAARTSKVLRKFSARYYWLGYARDDRGRIYWGTYPKTEVIGVDPETDKVFSLGRMSEDPAQSYALKIAAADDGTLYVPVGEKRPELFACDTKSGRRRQILTADQIRALERSGAKMINVLLHKGRVYAYLAGKTMLCTPDGLKEDPGVGKLAFGRNDSANGRMPDLDFGDGRTALRFTEKGLVVLKDGREELIPVDGLPAVGHEIYALGSVRGGRLFGSGIFPSNVFSVDLETLRSRDYGQISGGRVQNYDLADAPGGVLLASYTRSHFDLLDPDAPIVKGTNPRRIGDLRKFKQDRPFRLTPGETPEIFYAGTMPDKNEHGGAVVKIDVKSGKIQAWRGPVADQSVMEVVKVKDKPFTLLGLTNIDGGTGAKPIAKSAEIFLFDPASGRTIWHGAPITDANLYQGAARMKDGTVMFLARRKNKDYEWCLFDPEKRAVVRRAPLANSGGLWSYTARDADRDGGVYFIVPGTLYRYSPGAEKPVKLFSHPLLMKTKYITFAPDGCLYFFSEAELLRVRFGAAS